MRKLKRVLSCMVCSAMVAGMLGGCGGGQSTVKETTAGTAAADTTEAEPQTQAPEAAASNFQSRLAGGSGRSGMEGRHLAHRIRVLRQLFLVFAGLERCHGRACDREDRR